MKKRIFYILFGVVCFLGMVSNVDAAGLGISASSTSINPGGTVNIKVSASGLIGKFSVTSSNSNVLSGGTNSVWLEDGSESYKFTAKNLGKATITVKAIDASDKNGNAYSGSKSITINVVKPREKSKINYLNGISIDGYTLSPAFNKDTLEYTVEIGDTVDKIKLNVTKGDEYQTVSGIGDIEVVEGDNKLEIVVTPEVGDSKTYTVIASVKDSSPIVVKLDDKEYTVVKRSSVLEKPDDFEETKVTIDGIDIPAFKNGKANLLLVGLKDSEGKIALYIYDNDKYTRFDSLKSDSINIISKTTTDIPKGYEKGEIVKDGKTYTVYKDGEHILVYGLNINTNETGWYLYDEKENTLQRYDYVGLDNLKGDYNKKANMYLYIAIGLGFACVTLLIILLVVIVRNNKKSKINYNLMKVASVKKERQPEKKEEEIPRRRVREEVVKEKPKKKEIDDYLKDDDEMSLEFLDKKPKKKK